MAWRPRGPQRVVNVEQTSKRAMRRLTPSEIVGKAGISGEASGKGNLMLRRGSDGGTCGQRERDDTGSPRRWVGSTQPETREGRTGPLGMADGLVGPAPVCARVEAARRGKEATSEDRLLCRRLRHLLQGPCRRGTSRAMISRSVPTRISGLDCFSASRR